MKVELILEPFDGKQNVVVHSPTSRKPGHGVKHFELSALRLLLSHRAELCLVR